MTRISKILLAVALMSLVACSTPQVVRDQANASAANLEKVSKALRRQAAQAEEQDKRRIARVTGMHHTADDITEGRIDRQVGAARDLFIAVTAQAEATEKRLAESRARRAALEAEVRASAEKLAVPKDELAAAQKALAELGKKGSFKDRVGFLFGFIKETADEYKELTGEAEADGESADEEAEKKAAELQDSLE